MRQPEIHRFHIDMLLIDTVNIHRRLAVFVHSVNIRQGNQCVVFRHKAPTHIFAQVKVHPQGRAPGFVPYHFDITHKKMLWLVVQLQHGLGQRKISERHERGGVTAGDLNAARLGRALAVRVRLEKGNYPTIRASPNSQRRFLISVCSSMKGKG